MQSIYRLKQQLTQLIEKGASSEQSYLYLETHAEPENLLLWLKVQTPSIKMYWHDKCGDLEVAAIGACHQVSQVNCPTRINIAVYYGGVGFQAQTATWPNFGYSRFVLPRLELRLENNQYRLRCHLDLRENHLTDEVAACLALLEQVIKPQADQQFSYKISNSLISRTDLPNSAQWNDLVNNAISAQCQSLFSKVVLSRQTKLSFTEPVDAWQLLAKWQQFNINCYKFAFQFNEQQCFIGCSPERLFMRSGNKLTTEALAGTIVRGDNSEQDQKLAQKLKDDPKIIRENTLVSEDILARLQSLCQDIGVNDLSVLKLNTIQHLKQRIHAYLHDDVSDDTLLAELHPTPAVGGYPRDKALAFILSNEPYPRGWYAGAVGYISEQESEFSVAIRSALVENNHVNLYAGAGIVKGSESALEWQELDNKINTVLAILTPEPLLEFS